MRTIAIGLDGCSWNVLDPLLETGQLPNLAAMRQSGTHGVLESTIPFFTGPAWASFATGSSPAAHGIYDFMMLRDDGRLSVANQDDLSRMPYFQQLGREGKASVIVNLPLDQSGASGSVIVNSWLTDSESRRILPVGRRERYRTLLESYKTFPTDARDLDELCAIEQARFDLARELFLAEPWDHFFILFSSTDWLGHMATGSFLRGDEDARAAFLRLYRQLDGYIGWMAERAPDATMTVLSDHGQTEETAVFRVNAVLGELGLISLVDRPAQEENPFFVTRQAEQKRQVGVPSLLGRYRHNRLVRPAAMLFKRALLRGLGVELTRASRSVDLTQSAAFSPTDASFAVYARNGASERLDEIREALLSVELDDGRRAVDGVWTPEELYGRQMGEASPSLLFSPALGVRPSALIKDSVVSPPRAPGRGCHQRDGIVLVSGPGVVSGEIGRASIYDLAPTLLWAMGSGVPAGGDGNVLFGAFDDDFVSAHPLREVEPGSVETGDRIDDDDHAEVTRRLKALGYI
jgi:predicted AlkP superfamily phosphohydrolase/phosphomutase